MRVGDTHKGIKGLWPRLGRRLLPLLGLLIGLALVNAAAVQSQTATGLPVLDTMIRGFSDDAKPLMFASEIQVDAPCPTTYTFSDLCEVLDSKITAPTADQGLADDLPLYFKTGENPPWNTRQLTAPGIAAGAIRPEHLSTAYTAAQWNAILGLNLAGSGSGLTQSQVDARINLLIPDGQRVPTGGTANQFLAKKSDTDGDTEWRDSSVRLTTNQTRKLTALTDPLGFNASNNAQLMSWYGTGWVNALINGSSITQNHDNSYSIHLTPATATQNGLMAAADKGKVDAIPAEGSANADKLLGFDGDGNYAAVDAASSGGGGDITGVTAGNGLTGGGTTGTVRLDVENPATKRLVDFENYGLDGDGQTQQADLIAQHLGSKPTASNLEDFTYTTFYPVSFYTTNQWAGIRIPLADKDEVNHYEVYVSESDGGNRFAVYQGNTWEHVTDSGGYARYTVQITDKPADQGLSVWKYQRLGIDGYDVAIDYNKLDNRPHLQDGRELIAGNLNPGVTVAALNANSAVGRTNLKEQLDVQSEPHGVLLALLTPTAADFTATDIRFAQTEYDGETTIESVARAPPYATTTSDFGRTLVYADLLKGSTVAGRVVVKLAHDISGDTFLTTQYLAQRGHSLTDSGNIALQLELFVISSGAPRGIGGGQYFEFATKPDAADFTDGDLIIVTTGSDQGGWIKSSSETVRAADTGLTGVTLNPNSNFVSVADVAADVDYFSRASFTGPNNTSIPAGGTWPTAPAALARIVLYYNHQTLDNGSIVIRYNTARTYSGPIVIQAGNRVLRITGSGQEWRWDGLSADYIHAFRTNPWTFSEPGATGYTVTHTLTKVLAGVPTPPTQLGTIPISSSGTTWVDTGLAIPATAVWLGFMGVSTTGSPTGSEVQTVLASELRAATASTVGSSAATNRFLVSINQGVNNNYLVLSRTAANAILYQQGTPNAIRVFWW